MSILNRLRFLSLLLSCALVAGCGGGPGQQQQQGGGATPPPDEKVRIGAFMSLTGDTGQYGLSASNGMLMAVEEANTKGGVGGRRVELLVRDTRSDVGETVQVVSQFIGEAHVHALLGEIVSSRSLIAAPVAQAAGVPMLTPSSTSAEITSVGDYIFRSCYADPFQGAAIAQFAAHTFRHAAPPCCSTGAGIFDSARAVHPRGVPWAGRGGRRRRGLRGGGR